MRLDELERLAVDLRLSNDTDFRKWAKMMLRVANGENIMNCVILHTLEARG